MKKALSFKNVTVHNLKGVDIKIPRHKLTIFSGVSGSGKSSLAFDTIFTEGQRRYVESLSLFARRQMGDLSRPEFEYAEGITPTISIEQKSAGNNPRSTVGTLTQIYDFLRVLFARVATPHCPISGEALTPQSKDKIIHTVQSLTEKSKWIILAPFAKNKKAAFKEEFLEMRRKGFLRIRLDGQVVNLEETIELDPSVSHSVDLVVDRITVNRENSSRIAEAVSTALEEGKGTCSILNAETEEEQLFSTSGHSPQSGLSYDALEPQDFSFNSPSGMCQRCQGLGTTHDFDLEKIIDSDKSIEEDCCSIAPSSTTVFYGNVYRNLHHLYGVPIDRPWKELSEEMRNIYLYGDGRKRTRMLFIHPDKGSRWVDYIPWKGVLDVARKRYAEAKSKLYRSKMEELMIHKTCPECSGSGLKPYPSSAKLNGLTIMQLTALPISGCLAFIDGLKLGKTEQLIAGELLKEIRKRIRFLLDVGLHYLTLDRKAPTLSGGEAQRVRLASQIGSGLVGVTYILDEPSIGLHPRDNTRLIHTLQHLRDQGNHVIVVEHDEETLLSGDHVVDFGPGAGAQGGEVIYEGSIEGLRQCKASKTGAYLSGKESIPIPNTRRKPQKTHLKLKRATHNNLKGIDAAFPLGVLTAVTGVSGSGKSSLILDTLYPALSHKLHRSLSDPKNYQKIEGIQAIDKVIAIDQSPIGRNPRSNPSTYIKLFDHIRDLFTQLPESRARGYTKGRFSFNVKQGSCERCGGMGMLRIDMDFLEPAWVECPVCLGKRFDHETLTIRYKEKTIYDILEMDVNEALLFFENQPHIHRYLELLEQVGMGYIKLGQPSTTLSGGEAQRIKLAKELVRPSTGKTLYILDEPTTGLHFHDISHLLNVLQRLLDRGNSVLVIEHNMDVVKTADWIIDMGPDGGAQGGEIIAEGTPEAIAKLDTPTGRALKQTFEGIVSLAKAPIIQDRVKDGIEVRGAQQNNLKSVNGFIPRGKMTVCCGPSGSGKSSFAIETIYAEGQRRYTDSLSSYARQFVRQMPKPIVEDISGLSPSIAIEQVIHSGNPRSTVGTLTEIYDFLRILFARIGTPHCPETGEVIQAISKDHVVEQILSMPEGKKIHVLAPVELQRGETFPAFARRYLQKGFLRIILDGEHYTLEEAESIPYDPKRKHSLFLVVDRLTINPTVKMRLYEAVETAAEMGNSQIYVDDKLYNLAFSVPSTGQSYPEITPHTFSFNTQDGMCPSCEGLGYEDLIEEDEGELNDLLEAIPCSECRGDRLNPLARHVTIKEQTIASFCRLPIEEALPFIRSIHLPKNEAKFLGEVKKQITGRLEFLEEVGLGYLSLERRAPTLSGGEAQRIRLARQLGSGLTGVLYVLDEPTIGLHPSDGKKLLKALKKLQELGNTLLIVEHDPDMILAADRVLEFGPGAGHKGGMLLSECTPKQLMRSKDSLTGAYLTGRKMVDAPKKSKKASEEFLSIHQATLHNLKNLSVAIPLGKMTTLAGVSGSGKSTLMHHFLKPSRDLVVTIDQAPIGRTIRADVATYTDILTPMRSVFAQVPHARASGLLPKHFSYNHRAGMCTNCWGLGYRRVEMHFLPPVRVECEECGGMRLNTKSLEVEYAGHNLGYFLEKTVEENHAAFIHFPRIRRPLEVLMEVGLGYLKLGQRLVTLSGGEAQRLKISREIAKRSKGETLYLMDEPTTGLHSDDIHKMLQVLRKLVNKGHTLVIIEHNLDIIRNSDYVIELGPGPGSRGGKVIFAGTPEELKNDQRAKTAHFL